MQLKGNLYSKILVVSKMYRTFVAAKEMVP